MSKNVKCNLLEKKPENKQKTDKDKNTTHQYTYVVQIEQVVRTVKYINCFIVDPLEVRV